MGPTPSLDDVDGIQLVHEVGHDPDGILAVAANSWQPTPALDDVDASQFCNVAVPLSDRFCLRLADPKPIAEVDSESLAMESTAELSIMQVSTSSIEEDSTLEVVGADENV